ncbi:flavin-containing monooxygenase [Zavarzinia compransoris]|uniref:4-hydroxyacetophenone monooxygenase n=1 Tax=Zavarzinia compransoris TaxID=1264899 RepID=A0A317E6S3_9PROT|nr:NAD(P)/FAD-dependent oxidoreductase [Zavarzinia compransoris]PWR21926.1 4-hydroxyacetophenone monooxygenase [Zavarzinia compransoris]TDP47340.1 cation diffusion facilitator CzcD-associated flavoprotein CzcO [Zavarzinia compransoris]
MTPVKVCVIGTGFAGLCMAIQLKRAGIEDFVILDKADKVGGTWRENSYPGAGCDVPCHLYSYSFEQNPDWSRRFAKQPEIIAYIEHCARKYDLHRHIRFGTEVTEATFDEARGLWTVRTAAGEAIEAQFVVSGLGQLSRPQFPRIRGMDAFKGKAFHSAYWDHGYDLRGKRVAVIGTGASAVQFVPEVQKAAQKLSLFQRSPAWMISKDDRVFSPLWQALCRYLPGFQRAYRNYTYLLLESRFVSFRRSTGFFARLATRQCQSFLDKSVKDPALKAKLQPDFPVGCKRILISNDWYPALSQPNVDVVTAGVREIVETGVVTDDGRLHEVDCIIYGTGFETQSFIAPMKVWGRQGAELNERWRNGAEAHKGVAIAGFPNFFVLYGPNTNLGHNSIIFMIERQVGYILKCLREVERRNAAALDVTPNAMSDYNARLQQDFDGTVWTADCSSWYRNAAGRITNNWPGFTVGYWWLMREPDFNDFRFDPKAR